MFAKFVVISLMIFVKIADSHQVNPLKIIQGEDGLCSEKVGLIWQFCWTYFENMHAVTILGNRDGSLDFGNEIMKCSMKNPGLSIQYNSSIWNTTGGHKKRRLTQGDVFFRHKMNGLIFIKETAENVELILSPIDQETKVIMILTNISSENIENILKLAWQQYKLLDLVIFHTAITTNTIQGEALDLFVSIYNPFIIKNDARGLVHSFLMKVDDLLINKLMKIINNRLINVHGYPLTVVTSDKKQYGSDIKCHTPNCEITHAIIKTLDFDSVYNEVSFGDELAEIEHGRADMKSKLDFIVKDKQSYSVFLFPADYFRFTFVTPKMHPSSTVTFVNVFSPVVSVALAFSYVAMVISWRWLHKKYHELIKNKEERNNNEREIDFMNSCCITFGNFLMVSQPGGGERRYERCLLISWLFFSMVVCYSYQGTMVERLTAGGSSRDINTLEELAESNLKILLFDNYVYTIRNVAVEKEAPKYYKKLLEHSEVLTFDNQDDDTYISYIKRVAEDRDSAMMCVTQGCKYLKYAMYSTEAGETIHIMEEEFFGGYNSVVVPLDSPYKDRFNEILTKLQESGLIQKWARNLDNELEKAFLMPLVYNPESRNDVYMMKDLSFIFWSWFGCCCFCCLIFLGELLWAYSCRIMDEAMMTFLDIFSR